MRTYGIERERFMVNGSGKVVPRIGELLPKVHERAKSAGLSESRFSFELFAGQVEDRTPPCNSLDALRDEVNVNDRLLVAVGRECGVTFSHDEFVDAGMVEAFCVNPFDARHETIWNNALSGVQRVAASVVIAVHVHISVTPDEVVPMMKRCDASVVEYLVRLGDHSNGKRIDAYRTVAGTDGHPPICNTLSELMRYIESHGGEKNVWDLVRYKPSTGTIEFRMFGSTEHTDEILGYVRACRYVLGI